MANEISLNVSLAVNKNGASVNLFNTTSGDLSGVKMFNGIQIVGTSDEAAFMGDITAPRMVVLRNLDPTNYVLVSIGGGTTTHLLPLDYPMVIPSSNLANTDVVLTAHTANCRVQVIAFEA